MWRLAVAVFSSFLLASPNAVLAEEEIDPFLEVTPTGPPESGVSFSMRIGYGFPLGAASNDVPNDDLSKVFRGSIPLQLDLGWRFTPHLYAGAFFEYALALLPSALKQRCDELGYNCSSSVIRFGADFVYTLLPRATFIPWAGIGVGYEIGKSSYSSQGLRVDNTFKGFEFAHLMVGADYRLSRTFRVGPFVNFTLAQYSTLETPVDPVTETIGPMRVIDVNKKAFHEWLQFGVKAAADL